MVSAGELDYVVIGAGSAGSVLANRLSADPENQVLLLEAGGWDDQPEIHRVDAQAALALLASEWSHRLDWGYVTEPEKFLGNRRIPIARGKVIGGSSSVNALMWVRGNPSDYDRWQQLGNAGWAFSDVLPFFQRAETYAGPGSNSTLRGQAGPVQVRALETPSPIARAFVEAARELGYGGEPAFDYNAENQQGSAFFYQTTRTADGHRSSAASAYLVPALDRPNLRVEVGAHVSRILLDGRSVTGVEYQQDGVTQTVRVRREAVLSAGTFETPKLLMLSGIGPAADLTDHGITPVVDLAGVGQNLQDHLFVPVCYDAMREHPAGAMISEAGMFTRTPAAGRFPAPDLQFTFGPIKFLPVTAPAERWQGPGFTFAPIGLLPRSRGEVRLRDRDPLLTAEVRANYLSHEADFDVLAHGLRLARELAHADAFEPLRGDELAPGEDVISESQIRDYIRANATTLWHPVGTCRMGNGEGAVVDSDLRVHGVAGLRVADASIMPRIVAGNTNAACVMIGEKAADLIIHKSRDRT